MVFYYFPTSFKHDIIIQILKKPLLDPNIITNYRPISQLPFLSKILKRILAIQLNRYIADNKLYDIFQSAFRRGHSTETALEQTLNNIYSTVSPLISYQLVLLYLSCSFDSLSHYILISRLEIIGLRGTILKWLYSYILNRSSSVKFCNFLHNIVLFIIVFLRDLFSAPPLPIYILPIHEIIVQFLDVYYHIYTDDIQLYYFLSNSYNVLTDKLNNSIQLYCSVIIELPTCLY